MRDRLDARIHAHFAARENRPLDREQGREPEHGESQRVYQQQRPPR